MKNWVAEGLASEVNEFFKIALSKVIQPIVRATKLLINNLTTGAQN
jgi:hypothetical protein